MPRRTAYCIVTAREGIAITIRLSIRSLARASGGRRDSGSFENSYYAGKTAVTKKKLGEGTAVHFGSTFSRENLSWLFEYLGIKEPFAELISAPETLEAVLREKEGKRYLFVLNFQAEEAGFTLHKEMRMMYTGERVQGEQKLPRFGTAVYEVM